MELGGCFGAAVEVNRHRQYIGVARSENVDVPQIVAVTILLLVIQICPAVETENCVVGQPFTNVCVFPSAARNNAWYSESVSTEQNSTQKLLKSGDISTGLACIANIRKHLSDTEEKNIRNMIPLETRNW